MIQDTVFSPSFGNRPSKLVGRDAAIRSLVGGLETAPGSRERSVVMLGQRGSGKTVLLWEIAERARDLDYVVATPTIVSEGMLERIVEKVQEAGEGYVKTEGRHISGGSIGALGFTAGLQFTDEVRESKSPQYKLTQLVRKLNEHGKGVLLLIDELQANSLDVKQLVITYQEMIGEGLDVAIVMAGLPGAVSATLNDKVLTFLNRATKVSLGALPQSDVDAFFANSFKKLGLSVPDALRKRASSAVSGSPYLLQLIGHNIVVYADESGIVDEDTLENAIDAARSDFENDICKTSLASLSEMDVSFLYAVASVGSPAAIGDIALSMNRSPDYAQKYRTRLIDAGIIEAPTRGKVSIALPYLEGYLRKELDE